METARVVKIKDAFGYYDISKCEKCNTHVDEVIAPKFCKNCGARFSGVLDLRKSKEKHKNY